MWKFEITQGGVRLASGVDSSRERCLFEAMCCMHSYNEEMFKNLVLVVKRLED